MNNAANTYLTTQNPAVLALTDACRLIAPSWPLDQLIAVNPHWEMRHLPYEDVASRLHTLAGIRAYPAAAIYASSNNPAVTDDHLLAAAARTGIEITPIEARLDVQASDQPGKAVWRSISGLLDSYRSPLEMSWREEITHQISQFCAARFQDARKQGTPPLPGSIYHEWLTTVREDEGIAIVMGTPALSTCFAELPEQRDALFEHACAVLELDTAIASHYAHALLLDILGWASWAAYIRWQARLDGNVHDLVPDILAIRLAWDIALWKLANRTNERAARRLASAWHWQNGHIEQLLTASRRQQQLDRLWQTAAEIAYQDGLTSRLASTQSQPCTASPMLQAVFCIDVRSERIRRHLEAQSGAIQTIGFAGFFGLPIAYEETGSTAQRPHLPGLVKPAMVVRESLSSKTRRRIASANRLDKLSENPLSMFALVESAGPWFAIKLIRDMLGLGPSDKTTNARLGHGTLSVIDQQGEVGIEALAGLLADILRALGLDKKLAPTVLIVGHGSCSTNNPHAAGLDCGACGGQTGELNARLLCRWLNEPAIRLQLASLGIEIPDNTRFVGALHNTTTDEIDLLDQQQIADTMRSCLAQAGTACRRERAQSLGETETDDKQLLRRLRRRSHDWSETRPEWGLAGNAAFIIAPRDHTRGMNLGGRVFLHDYNADSDPQGTRLHQIMTAPMIVTHWINSQYNASVADNARLGSGNKILHNVVGGGIGVFEGNGGDLRIGLPLQSVHDGSRWMHLPLRLTVFIAAPAERIEAVYDAEQSIRQLVDNEWLYLLQMDENGERRRLMRGNWETKEDRSCTV